MRTFLLFLLIIIVVAIGAAPYVDGYQFEKIFKNQIQIYQGTMQTDKAKLELVEYKRGWMQSTAKLKLTFTPVFENPNALYHLPPMVMEVDTTIDHGPLIYDTANKSYKLAYANVVSTVHLPDIIKAFLPDTTGQGFLQIQSVVPLDGKTWYNHYVIPPITIAGKVNWDGLTGDGVVHYSDTMPINVNGKFVFGAITVPPNPALPFIPSINVQPINYALDITQTQLHIWNGTANASMPGFSVKWMDGRLVSADTLAMNSTFGLDSDNLYNYSSQYSMNKLILPPLLPVTEIDALKTTFALNKLDPKGIQSYIEYVRSHPNLDDEVALQQQMLKILAPTSNLNVDLSLNTNLGAASGNIKLSLQGLPKDPKDLADQTNANINARAAVTLINGIIADYFTKLNAKQEANMPAPLSQPVPVKQDAYKETVAKLMQSKQVSMADALTLVGYENAHLNAMDFSAKLKAMPQINPAIVTQLQSAYAQQLADAAKTPAPVNTPTNLPDPTVETQQLINSWIQQGLIVKDNNDYTLDFTKQGPVYKLNGKDVSAQATGLMHMPQNEPGPVIPQAPAPAPAPATGTTAQ